MAISPKDLLKYAEVRWGIECYAARRAAEVATAEDLAELEKLLEQMDHPKRDYLETLRLDLQFHRKLIDITGNEVMQNLMEVIHEFVIAGMMHTTPKPLATVPGAGHCIKQSSTRSARRTRTRRNRRCALTWNPSSTACGSPSRRRERNNPLEPAPTPASMTWSQRR